MIFKMIITRLQSQVKRQVQTRNKLKITFKTLHNIPPSLEETSSSMQLDVYK